jgi:hypothetical protein
MELSKIKMIELTYGEKITEIPKKVIDILVELNVKIDELVIKDLKD